MHRSITQLVDLHGRLFGVKHRMTIGADRPQIFDRINDVFSADRGQIDHIVDVDEPMSELPILFLEVEAADTALATVVRDRGRPSCSITFVAVDQHLRTARSK